MRLATLSLVVLTISITGCQNQSTQNPDAGLPPILHGPIKECRDMRTDAGREYVAEARKVCETATTQAEKFENKGCAILNRHQVCW